jgi:hypothetical protein
MQGIECLLFDEIYPRSSASQKTQIPVQINTASLHRYLFLAHQARDYYLQLSAQVLGNSGSRTDLASMLFNPFKDVGVGSDSKGKDLEDAGTQSRFGFAQQQQQQQSAGLLNNLSSQMGSVSLNGQQQQPKHADWQSNASRPSFPPQLIQQQQQIQNPVGPFETWDTEYRPPGFVQSDAQRTTVNRMW